MKKGISLVVLIVTIAVIITLLSTIVITGVNITNNTKKIKFASEISYIQELVNTYRENNNGRYPSSKKINIDTSKINQNDLETQFKNEYIYNNTLLLNKIDLSALNAGSLVYGTSTEPSSDDVYCVSAVTGRVYYIRGLKIGNNTYYTLTDELKKKINYLEDNNINDGILFVYNTSYEETAKVDIKIPSSYTDIEVTSTDEGFSYDIDEIQGYIVYKSKSLLNSTIIVKYKNPGKNELKEIKYKV